MNLMKKKNKTIKGNEKIIKIPFKDLNPELQKKLRSQTIGDVILKGQKPKKGQMKTLHSARDAKTITTTFSNLMIGAGLVSAASGNLPAAIGAIAISAAGFQLRSIPHKIMLKRYQEAVSIINRKGLVNPALKKYPEVFKKPFGLKQHFDLIEVGGQFNINLKKMTKFQYFKLRMQGLGLQIGRHLYRLNNNSIPENIKKTVDPVFTEVNKKNIQRLARHIKKIGMIEIKPKEIANTIKKQMTKKRHLTKKRRENAEKKRSKQKIKPKRRL